MGSSRRQEVPHGPSTGLPVTGSGFSTYAAVAGFPTSPFPWAQSFIYLWGYRSLPRRTRIKALAVGRAIEQILRVRLRATLIDPAPNS